MVSVLRYWRFLRLTLTSVILSRVTKQTNNAFSPSDCQGESSPFERFCILNWYLSSTDHLASVIGDLFTGATFLSRPSLDFRHCSDHKLAVVVCTLFHDDICMVGIKCNIPSGKTKVVNSRLTCCVF